jgi:hypothetical protein
MAYNTKTFELNTGSKIPAVVSARFYSGILETSTKESQGVWNMASSTGRYVPGPTTKTKKNDLTQCLEAGRAVKIAIQNGYRHLVSIHVSL